LSTLFLTGAALAGLLMGNAYFDPGSQRAAKVKELFARIAPRYDLINDLQSAGLHRLWKRKVLALARPAPGERALDLCCGTGDLALALASAGATVAGLDFSGEMLRIAHNRMARRANTSGAVRFVRADALRIPFPDGSFDIVTIGYGLRNLADLEAGLREARRVLRPGGRLVALDFGKPQAPLARKLYFGYLRAGVPLFGRLFCGDAAAYAYILESLERFPARAELADRLSSAGFENARATDLCGGVMVLIHGEIGCQKQGERATIRG
jgi:demethylmenaquinone methyltransferase/2-methoxy-6-polyprenyl-1,4-benzoquinol methylase